MPLTVAHAAAAWPLRHLLPRLPLAALVIGAMSPDFEYFLRLAPRGHFGHELLGLLAFCLPASLLVWGSYAALVRPAWLALLPSGVRTSLAAAPARFGWRRLGWAAVAALVGASTHLGWDLFTHERGLAELTIPALRGEIAPSTLGNLRWYQLLQHLSTGVGLVAVMLWAGRAWRRFPPQARHFSTAERGRAAQAILVLAATGVLGAVLNGARAWGRGPRPVLGYAAVGGMLALGLALLGHTVVVRLMRAKPAAADEPRSPAAPGHP